MKVCVIYDKKGQCPSFSVVVPNKDVFIREISLSSKDNKEMVYNSYPEDYCLFEIDFSSGKPVISCVVEFTDFIQMEKKENEPHD